MPKILIADDNTNIQKMVALAFEERGIDVVSVGNGETAVRKLPDVNPDLVLADVFMPVRNGYEVCEFVKKDTRFAQVPVILLVGAFDPLDEKEARRVGADGVLKKPFVPPDPLIAMVMSALERNPRVAAELAKAKEVIPEPEPLPQVLENPAQKEPAPLPDFPEPTAEEAAQIYGFGKGVRTLDEVEESANSTAPKKPAVEEEDEDEEFDGTSTQHDWKRRRGMDLDIPDDVSAQPTFSMDQDSSPIAFPSEKDVPPRRVRARDAEEEPVEVAKPHLELPLEPSAEAVAEPPAKSTHEAPAVASGTRAVELPAPAVAEPEPVPARTTLSSILARMASPQAAASPEPQASSVSAPAIEEQAAPAPQHKADVTASHWMDLMSPAPSSHGSGSWLDALSAKAEAAMSEPAPATIAEPAASVQAEEPEAVEWHEEVAAVAPASAPEPEHFEPAAESDEPRAFDADSSRSGSSYHFSSDEPAHEAASSYEEPPPEAPAAEPEVAAPSASAEAEKSASFFEREPEAEPAASAAPAPPAEPIAPPHEFAAETTVAEAVSQFFSSSQDAIERIPTAPPPNREALAGIPFLVPPKEITEPVDVTPPAPNGASPVDVDAVVQRVVEKLGPQLQEMLAQGLLKPLVESMLQQELAKKDK